MESIRLFLELPPTRLAPAITGAAARARQRASVRVAARSRRVLRRAGEEEEEASKGKRLLPMALPTDDDGGGEEAIFARPVAAGAFLDAKLRCSEDGAADSRDDIARVQLLSIKEREKERSQRLEKRVLAVTLLFFLVCVCVCVGKLGSPLLPFFTPLHKKKKKNSALPHHPPAPVLQRPRVLGPSGEHRPRDLFCGRRLPPLCKVEACPLGAGGRRQRALKREKVLQFF